MQAAKKKYQKAEEVRAECRRNKEMIDKMRQEQV